MNALGSYRPFPRELVRRIRFVAAILCMSGQRKHIVRWLRSAGGTYLLDTPSPWMTFDAIKVLDAYVKPGMQVFEYGSGGSTLYWVAKGAAVISIEHDARWYAVVRNRLADGRNVDYRLVEPEPGMIAGNGDPADPYAYASDGAHYGGDNFRNYVSQIDAFPDQSFDLVSIDGRARPSCLMHAAKKVRPGGLLVLDNAERLYYLKHAAQFLSGFQEQQFPGCLPVVQHTSQTNLYWRTASHEVP
jgi:hypothetical protein